MISSITQMSLQGPALPSIAVVTCWYGSFPWYFPYFVKSCAYNQSIDFIIVSDNQEVILEQPKNLIIVYKTINEIKDLASKKLKLEVNIDYPYKLCDFKPAYGYIFSDILKSYDFWGHGDIDVVYGNIRGFITDEILRNYDVISSRHDYVTGSFCLFRNIANVNELFLQSRDYKKVFTSSYHFCFDECSFLFAELTEGYSVFDFPDNIQSMTYLVKKAEAEGKLKAFFDFLIIEGTPGKLKWRKGTLIYKNMFEVMFYHLIKFKEDCSLPKKPKQVPDFFSFTPTKIKHEQN